MRFSAVESSTGIGLPSAVEGTRLVEDGLARKGLVKEKGKGSRRGSLGLAGRVGEAVDDGGLWRELA